MIGRLKAFIKRHWPGLRLRTILLTVLIFSAAMPAVGAIFLRVWENTIVRQTEAELTAQGAVFAAALGAAWPGNLARAPRNTRAPGYYRPEPPKVDLSSDELLSERPLRRPTGQLPDPGAFAAAASAGPTIDEAVRTTLASVVILDRKGQVVRGFGAGSNLADLPEVARALKGQPGTVLRRNGDYLQRSRWEWLSRASMIRIHHARPIRVNGQVAGVVLLSRSPRALFRGLYEDRLKFAMAGGVILLTLIILAGLVSRGVTQPIERLSKAAREVTAGRGEALETPGLAAVEIRALYEDFAEMAAAIERRSRYLQGIAAAVSHEFKTPLAGITGATELLIDHHDDMTEEERRRFLANIAADADRLSQLVRRLLDLARADMARPASDLTPLASPLHAAADSLSGPGFAVEVGLEDGEFVVAAPEATLRAVATTLLENSRQAGAAKASITVRAEDGCAVLRFRDDGPGIPKADRERIFEPFFTSRRAEGGTGLGLAIARSLLAASRGSLEMAPGKGGAVFEVRIPLAA